ncbi:MAG TPA: glycosyltransferase, partial [Segetibacter sp.]
PGQNISREDKFTKNKKDDRIRFVYVGRITKIKGLHTLLHALKKIGNKRWSLDIYGQVGEEDYYLECCNIIRYTNGDINWKGIIPPKAVVTTLMKYDVLIVPTIIQEMVGLVVQEAFSAGIPVIGSDVEGIVEQVTDNLDGLLFKNGDSESLRRILTDVIVDVSLIPRLASNIKAPRLFLEVATETLKVYKVVFERRRLSMEI